MIPRRGGSQAPPNSAASCTAGEAEGTSMARFVILSCCESFAQRWKALGIPDGDRVLQNRFEAKSGGLECPRLRVYEILRRTSPGSFG